MFLIQVVRLPCRKHVTTLLSRGHALCGPDVRGFAILEVSLMCFS